MSENDIHDADEPTTTAPAPPAGITLTPRSLAAIGVIIVLVGALAVGLVISKNDKDNENVAGGNGKAAKVAAVVNGVDITAKALDAEVAPWLANKEFVAAMTQAGTPIVDARGNAVASYRAQRLESLIQQTIFEAEFKKAGLKASETYANDLRQQITADPSAKGFSKEFIDEFVSTRSHFEALRVARSKPITDQQIQASYAQQLACESGKSVTHLLVATEAEANAALQRIQGGEDFAKVAGAVSTDTGSKAKGGDLGCLAAGTFVAEFEKAAMAAPLDTATQPVKTEFGYHVIKTTAFAAPPLAEVRDQIVQALQSQDTSGNEALRKLLTDAKVKVDPTIGTWGDTGQGALGIVVKDTGSSSTTVPGTPTTRAVAPGLGTDVRDERPPKDNK